MFFAVESAFLESCAISGIFSPAPLQLPVWHSFAFMWQGFVLVVFMRHSTLKLFWICLPFESLLSSPSLWEVDKAVLISMNDCFSLYYSSDDSWLRTKHAHIVLFLPRLLSIAFAFWYHIPTSVKDVPINLSLLKWLLENTEGKIRKQTDWISYEGPMVWAPFCWYAGELTRLSSLTLMEKFITCHVNFQTLQRHLLLLICYITWLFLNAQISKKELFYQSWNSKITSH